MKKTTLLASLLLMIILLGSWALTFRRQGTLVDPIDVNSLKYFIHAPSGISLDPVESDNMANAILMKHLVGTLMRYSNGGQFLPYLAEKFKSEDAGLVWKFTIRRGMACEDGESITAQGYVDGLQKVLKMYSNQGALPVFENLIGWKDYLKGKPLRGLSVLDTYEVEFRFDRLAGPGFLEYLSMPYYGYFCASNFNNFNWKSKNNIISSSSYYLDRLEYSPRAQVLKKRENWILTPPSAPKKVVFHTSIDESSWKHNRAIIQANLGWDVSPPASHKKVKGPPDVIRNIVLDPTGPSQFFNDINARRALQEKILSVREKKSFLSKTAVLTKSFYPGVTPNYVKNSTSSQPSKKLKIYFPKTASDDTNYVVTLLKEALNELGWKYDVFIAGETPGIVSSDSQSKTKFDIRISSVVAGSVVEPWVVEMMFGSGQGVSYPDPSGKVVAYARELSNKSTFSFKEAGQNISQIIAEDAAVIPIYHSHTTWYFTEDLDISRLSGDLIIPSFEDIGIKE